MFRQLVIASLALITVVNGEDADSVLLHRTKRATITACRTVDVLKKYNFISDHTACLLPSSEMNRSKTGVSDAEKIEIVNVHNEKRASEDATDMNKLSWDDEIAYLAQKWADNCVFEHESGLKRRIPGKYSLGQNLFASSGSTFWTNAVNAWYNEIQYFTYNSSDNEVQKVGHYAQVVTAKTLKVGCGYTLCQYADGKISHFYVCNYGPGASGGVIIPFNKGTKCADCPSTCTTGQKLCNCNLVCLNGGTLDPKTCTCSCQAGYSLPDCALNCTVKKDPYYCKPPYYDEQKCYVYSNAPETCAHLCNICPNGGIDVTGPTDKRGEIGFDLTGVDIYTDKENTDGGGHSGSNCHTEPIKFGILRLFISVVVLLSLKC